MFRMKGRIYTFYHPHVIAQQQLASAEKLAIAEAAAGLVNNNDVIMISAGTTTALIPRFLLLKEQIRIIT